MQLNSIARYKGRVHFVTAAIGGRALNFLDVGNLGDGNSENLLNKHMVEAAFGTYHGLDSNAELTKRLALPNQHVGDIHQTNLDGDSFDMLYLGEVIEHTWLPTKMIGECRRILKTGGELVIDTPNPYALGSLLRYIFQRRDSMGDNRILTYHEASSNFDVLRSQGKYLLQPKHKIFFTPAMMKQLLETQGFLITHIGFTIKAPFSWLKWLVALCPHLGAHLCIIAKKATVDDAFMDVIDKKYPSVSQENLDGIR